MRKDYNNPTEVIMRLLHEIDALVNYIDTTSHITRQVAPHLFTIQTWPTMPRLDTYNQQLGYRRRLGNITEKNRNYMRRMRTGAGKQYGSVNLNEISQDYIVEQVGKTLPKPHTDGAGKTVVMPTDNWDATTITHIGDLDGEPIEEEFRLGITNLPKDEN